MQIYNKHMMLLIRFLIENVRSETCWPLWRILKNSHAFLLHSPRLVSSCQWIFLSFLSQPLRLQDSIISFSTMTIYSTKSARDVASGFTRAQVHVLRFGFQSLLQMEQRKLISSSVFLCPFLSDYRILMIAFIRCHFLCILSLVKKKTAPHQMHIEVSYYKTPLDSQVSGLLYPWSMPKTFEVT